MRPSDRVFFSFFFASHSQDWFFFFFDCFLPFRVVFRLPGFSFVCSSLFPPLSVLGRCLGSAQGLRASGSFCMPLSDYVGFSSSSCGQRGLSFFQDFSSLLMPFWSRLPFPPGESRIFFDATAIFSNFRPSEEAPPPALLTHFCGSCFFPCVSHDDFLLWFLAHVLNFFARPVSV